MVSAMYENGGNTTHRILDGHPELYVYPFESQIGTKFVNDPLSSMFPVKYRWPVFDLAASATEDYSVIIDEEAKVRARTPLVSKFRHLPFDFSDDERRAIYCKLVAKSGRSAGGNVGAFFEATFLAWKDYRASGREKYYIGYSPIFVVDTVRMLSELPNGHVLHVVRNPWSAYADTKKRPVPLRLESYMQCWMICQYYALMMKKRYPESVHVVRVEDVLENPTSALTPVCQAIGVDPAALNPLPTWNGTVLDEVYPWGTIRNATSAANRKTAEELSAEERDRVRDAAGGYLTSFCYESFWD
jgi:hypothetical protein